jgi:LmbE family N-acetylglucosaminyl deacetylase
MFANKNILAIGAHPDDIEWGCLGTLLTYNSVCNIYCYISALGRGGDPIDPVLRKAEAEATFKTLGPEEIFWPEKTIPDPPYHDSVKLLDDIIKYWNINMIFTPSYHDAHQDHRLIHEITITACRRSLITVLCYPTPGSTFAFNPRLFCDITEVFEDKCAALLNHTSQKDKFYLSRDFLESMHSDTYALICGKKAWVERFEIEKCFI